MNQISNWVSRRYTSDINKIDVISHRLLMPEITLEREHFFPNPSFTVDKNEVSDT